MAVWHILHRAWATFVFGGAAHVVHAMGQGLWSSRCCVRHSARPGVVDLLSSRPQAACGHVLFMQLWLRPRRYTAMTGEGRHWSSCAMAEVAE